MNCRGHIFHNRCWENLMVVKCCNAFVSSHYEVAFLLQGQVSALSAKESCLEVKPFILN